MYYKEKILDLLLYPEKLKIVSSFFQPEQAIINCKSENDWYLENNHSHELVEVMLTLQGECHYGFEDKIYLCEPGTLLIFDKNEKHSSYYVPSTDDVCHLWFSFAGGISTAMFRVMHKKKVTRELRLFLDDLPNSPFRFSQCLKELRTADNYTDECKRKKLSIFLNVLLIDIYEHDFKNKITTFERHKKTVKIIKAFLDENCGKGFDLKAIASIAGFSKYHFTKIFKQQTGMTIHDYINIARKKKVRLMLEKGFMKKEISDLLGFSTPVAFSIWQKNNYL